MPVNPHFDLPFRFAASGSFVMEVEQDTEKDVANCVEVILRTPVGLRWYVPDFGIADPTFKTMPIDVNAIAYQISLNEPRAQFLIQGYLDFIDGLIQRIRVELL